MINGRERRTVNVADGDEDRRWLEEVRIVGNS